MLPKPAPLSAAILVLSAAAWAAPCDPGFAAIHEFQVGDVFQYRFEGGVRLATTLKWEGFRKERIASKSGGPLARSYVIQVLIRRDLIAENGNRSREFEMRNDTVRFIDSAGHPLNACAGDTVRMPESDYQDTRVEAAAGDTGWFSLASPNQRMKRIGSISVHRPGDPIVDGPRYTQIYAEGLGMVREYVSSMSNPLQIRVLTGFVRGAETKGQVMSDGDLTEPLPTRLPKPQKAGVQAGYSGPGFTPWVFDLRGRNVRQAGGWNIQVTP